MTEVMGICSSTETETKDETKQEYFERVTERKGYVQLEFSNNGILAGTRHYGERVVNTKKENEPVLVQATCASVEPTDDSYCVIC
jgi:hypothetical protein